LEAVFGVVGFGVDCGEEGWEVVGGFEAGRGGGAGVAAVGG
jgi:hypothetical protein